VAETIKQALSWAVATLRQHSIESAHIDAWLLAGHCLKRQKAYLLAHPEYILSDEESSCLRDLIERRCSHEPVAYIIGEKEFWSKPFLCNPATLIPRPETELVVETALEFFAKRQTPPQRLLDLGTGTGCIGISLALEWPGIMLVLTDVDADALRVARQNVSQLLGDKERSYLVCTDWFQALSTGEKYDLITVNPPYVSHEDAPSLSEDIMGYEPHKALFSPKRGLFEIERIFGNAHRYLSPKGAIICEIGWNQGERVLCMVKDLNLYGAVFVKKDLSGHDRVIVATL